MNNVAVVFDLGDILSVTTGILMSPDGMKGVYRILNYMTGDDLFMPQLPRVSLEMTLVIFEQHPQLQDIQAEEMESEDVWKFLNKMKSIYGDSLPIIPCGIFQHQKIDPQEEAEQIMKGKEDKIFIIPLGEDE